METGSFLELSLTIYAWQVSNRLSELLVGSGLIFLPLGWLAWKNWAQPARAQEAKAAAPVSLRRMEQDVGIYFLTIMLAFIPFVPITPADVTYKSLDVDEIKTAETEFRGGEDANWEVKVPVLWWSVHQVSAGISGLMTNAVLSFHTPQHYRAIALALDYTQVRDPQLRAELGEFDRDCYLPALAKLERDNSTDQAPEWRADQFFFQNGYYNDALTATRTIDSWADIYNWLNPSSKGKPTCAEWWSSPQRGLESRLYRMILAHNQDNDAESSKAFMGWAGATEADAQRHRGPAVRRYLSRSPVAPNLTHAESEESRSRWGNWSVFENIAGLGALLGYYVVRITTSLIKIGLPMVQAVILGCVYIALPVAVPFAALRPGVIVFFAGAIFSLKMLNGLWALAYFIDEKIIEIMYGTERAVFVSMGLGHTADLVLSIITSLSYIGLPMIWFWLMGSVMGHATAGINSFFQTTSARFDAAGQQASTIALAAAKEPFLKKPSDDG